MGRPGKNKDVRNTQNEDPLKFKRNLAGKSEKQKTFRSFKKSGGLQKSIGNASKGHGLSHKARILSRFKKRFMSKKTKGNKNETFHIKPLAVDRRDESAFCSQSQSADSEKNDFSSTEEEEEEEENEEDVKRNPKPIKGRLEELKKEEEVFVLKPSPKKVESPNGKSHKKNQQHQGPKFMSSKLASTKCRTTNSNINLTDGPLRRRSNAGKKSDTSATGRIEVDYEAIEEERQKEVLKLQSKKVAKEYEQRLNENIQQRKSITKSLKQRTKRGQPIMANQIEHILQKVKMTS